MHKSFLIELYDKELMLVHVLYNPFREEDPTSQVNYFYCSKPNGKWLRFSIFVWDTGLRWVSVKSLGEIVLFLNTCSRCTFYAKASNLTSCKKNCIVFSEPRWEPNLMWGSDHQTGHDVYVADLQTRKIQPLEMCPGYSNLFQPPPESFTHQSWKLSGCSLVFSLLRLVSFKLCCFSFILYCSACLSFF